MVFTWSTGTTVLLALLLPTSSTRCLVELEFLKSTCCISMPLMLSCTVAWLVWSMSFCRCIFPRLDSPSCGWIASRVFQTFNARSVGRSFTFQLRVRQWWLWFGSLALTRPSSRPESAKDHGKVAVSSFLSVTNFAVRFNSVYSGTSRLSENKGADIKFVVALTTFTVVCCSATNHTSPNRRPAICDTRLLMWAWENHAF